MARALAGAQGRGPVPVEVEGYGLVRMFGAEAVFGRAQLTVAEMRCMKTAHETYTAAINQAEYIKAQTRETGGYDLVKWAEQHPYENGLIVRAMAEGTDGEG